MRFGGFMDTEELIELYKDTFPFWDKMSSTDKEAFLRSSHKVEFKKGTNIHNGNECTGIILVKKGCLRLYLLSDGGKEITLYRLFAGDMCIFSASCANSDAQISTTAAIRMR